MFVWYVQGQPRVYEPRQSGRVAGVVRAATVSSVLADTGGQGTTSVSSRTLKGYGVHEVDEEVPRRQLTFVSQIMASPVVTLSPDDSLETASNLFTSKKFRHAPVCDANGKLCGVLSERDLLRQLVKRSSLPIPDEIPVILRDFMKTSVLTAAPETEVRLAARVMFQEKIGALPVLDTDGKVVGILTRSDILKVVMNTVPFELWS
jgi:CBS domain-containing protein